MGTGTVPQHATPERLQVRLLGAVEVALDGRRLPAFDGIRLQRFLALITLRGDLSHRARLAYALWPDSQDRQARTNLRKLLHELRHALPDLAAFITINDEVVRWVDDASASVDVREFRSAIDHGDLRRATQLYSGDLLPACYDDWVLDERAALRDAAHQARTTLAQQAATRDDHAAAMQHARAALELEPTDETAVGLLMQGYTAIGDRTGALRAYHRYAEALEHELGVPPADAIRALYRQLRAAAPSGTPRGAEEQPAAGRFPFVGRRAELTLLAQTWAAARAGRAQFVVISGEPGVGKSRLAAELARHVRSEGHEVATSRAYEAAGRLPWGPVVEVLRSAPIQTQIASQPLAWRRELTRLLPELADQSASSDVSPDEPAQRHRLFDAVARVVVGARPRLLIIDDLQWCDAETIDVLGFILRSAAEAPILIAGTVRSEEVADDHPVVDLQRSLRRDGVLTSVGLERLDAAATAELTARLHPDGVADATLADRVWAETDGNPLFVIELLRAGIPTDGAAPLTPTMRAVLGARLGHLAPDVRRIADLAAVIGRPFSVELLTLAAGAAEGSIVDSVDDLWRRRIIRDHGTHYDFSHDKLRAVTVDMISPARRRQLHRAVAEAIRTGTADDPDSASPRLAAHYDQAGLPRQALEAYRRAGARAVAISALDEAVTAYRRALTLLEDLPPSRDRDALELDTRIALGAPLVALRGYGSQDAHQVYERAASLSRRLHGRVAPPILRGLGLARLQGCRFDDATTMGQALVDHADEDSIATTEGRYLLGVSAFWRGELASARHHLDAALDTYRLSRREEHLARYAQDPKVICLVRLAWIDLWAGDPARADERSRAALQTAVDLDHLMTLWYALTYASIIAAEAEDLARLTDLLADSERLDRRMPTRYLRIVGDALRAWLRLRSGSPQAIQDIDDAVTRSRASGETLHLTYMLLLLARARALTGDLAGGRAAAREALSLTQQRNQRYLEPELWRIDGDLAWQAGSPDAAEALRNAVAAAEAQGAGWLELRALHSLARRFPDDVVRDRLAELVAALPSGADLPAFHSAVDLLADWR